MQEYFIPILETPSYYILEVERVCALNFRCNSYAIKKTSNLKHPHFFFSIVKTFKYLNAFYQITDLKIVIFKSATTDKGNSLISAHTLTANPVIDSPHCVLCSVLNIFLLFSPSQLYA